MLVLRKGFIMRKIRILQIFEYWNNFEAWGNEMLRNTSFYLVKIESKISLFYEKDITPIVKVLAGKDNKDFEMEIPEISMDIIDSNGGALFTFAIKNHKLDILDDEIINYYFETLWDYAGRE